MKAEDNQQDRNSDNGYGTHSTVSCRDEVCRITVCLVGGTAMRTGTSEPRDRASWTLAASVHQADIDHGTWSSRRATRTRTRLWTAPRNPSLAAVRCDRMVILCGRCQHRNRRHGRQRPQHRRPRSDPDGPLSTRTRPARGALAPPHGLHQPGHPVSPRCGPRAPGCGGRASPGRRQPRSSDRRNAVTRRTAPAAAGHVGLTLQVRRHRADGRPHHSSPTVSTYRNGTSGMRAKTAHISFQPRGMSVRVARSIHIRTTASGWRKQISSSLLHDLEPTSAGTDPVTASVPSVRAPCGA
jgi:hypothetical protein